MFSDPLIRLSMALAGIALALLVVGGAITSVQNKVATEHFGVIAYQSPGNSIVSADRPQLKSRDMGAWMRLAEITLGLKKGEKR
jgi:hypothetical protein